MLMHTQLWHIYSYVTSHCARVSFRLPFESRIALQNGERGQAASKAQPPRLLRGISGAERTAAVVDVGAVWEVGKPPPPRLEKSTGGRSDALVVATVICTRVQAMLQPTANRRIAAGVASAA